MCMYYFSCVRADTQTMTVLGKKSIKIKNVKEIAWSPTDNILAFWVPEEGERPAKGACACPFSTHVVYAVLCFYCTVADSRSLIRCPVCMLTSAVVIVSIPDRAELTVKNLYSVKDVCGRACCG